MKAKGKVVGYVAFCQKCGFAKSVSKEVLQVYFTNRSVRSIFCTNCLEETFIPDYIRKIIDLL